MIESSDVLGLMKVIYTIYVSVAVCLVGIYGLGIVRGRKTAPAQSRERLLAYSFYGWIGLLVSVGIGLHVLTYNKIPWVKWDLGRARAKVDREFKVVMADYAVHLPEKSLDIRQGQTVRFNVESRDLTYGFGLFRNNGTMVFQMQVVPGSRNDLVWKFNEPATYTIRSTEYSGPKGGNLFLKDAVVVAGSPTVVSPEPLASPDQLLER